MREHVAETRGHEKALTPPVVQHAGAEKYDAAVHVQTHGHEASAGELSKTLQNGNSSSSSHLTRSLLRMQRTYGNSYVQRVLALARQGEGQGEVTPDVESAIERSRGGGQGLDTGTRGQMESAIGADFSGVRIHTGAESHELNRSVNAVAFTTGQDIFFRDGAYNPSNSKGKELLAHELTHVVQQGGAAPALQSKLVVGEADNTYEREADQVAKTVVNTLHAPTATPGPASTSVQRQCTCGEQVSGAKECEACREKRQSPASAKTESSAGAQGEVQRAPDPVEDVHKTVSDFKSEIDEPGNPHGQGAQKYPAIDRADWQIYFQQAIQGVSGKANLNAKKKAALASAIADECMAITARHASYAMAAMSCVTDEVSKETLDIALVGIHGDWSDSFRNALQSTTGGEYKSPREPVKQAADIADQAVFADGMLDERLWKIYMNAVAGKPCAPAPQPSSTPSATPGSSPSQGKTTKP
jgi:hypothetical protein